jgi:hypothetical protein
MAGVVGARATPSATETPTIHSAAAIVATIGTTVWLGVHLGHHIDLAEPGRPSILARPYDATTAPPRNRAQIMRVGVTE